MKLHCGYVYIPVSDFDKATEWYGSVMDFELVFTDPLYRELRSPSGIRVMLIERRSGVNSHMVYDTGPQAAYGFTVSDIEEIQYVLNQKGVTTKNVGEYQDKSFSFTDLDGNVIELWEEVGR